MKWGLKSIRLGVVVLGLVGLAIFFAKRPFAGEGKGVEADVADLERTKLSAHLETSIRDGQNVLWCGTFQLAWNEICSLLAEDLHFATLGRCSGCRLRYGDRLSGPLP